MALVVHYPGDVEEDSEAGEQYAERDEDGDGPATSSDVHALEISSRSIRGRRGSRV